ncbi:hypothetical protein [Alteromonas sp. ASW11-130]|uniref:hypothetical protein n=1 Tax=Alteromonas sp. ASW11-130 TaxID=3015775 RepID=UPI0022428962|nr:hypothetical protein [Alteromonas sp. ASW11-130]MCW8091932.1 hypothetical protein [Alteromonas sp. ASW11-130]
MSGQGSGGNVIAAVCSFFIPGLGQLVQGRVLSALVFCVLSYGCYSLAMTVILFFFWPIGLIFHIWSIINAARYRRREL